MFLILKKSQVYAQRWILYDPVISVEFAFRLSAIFLQPLDLIPNMELSCNFLTGTSFPLEICIKNK